MGNGVSSSERCRKTLEIETDEFVYSSGDRVSGVVSVDVCKEMDELTRLLDGIKDEVEVKLHVFGGEKCSAWVGDELNESLRFDSSNHSLMDMYINVNVDPSKLIKENDSCQIPFAFDLPTGLPSSMYHPNTTARTDSCRVEYFIHATLHYRDHKDNLLFSASTNMKPLRILSSTSQHTNSLTHPTSPKAKHDAITLPTQLRDLRLWFGYRLGYMSVSGSIDKKVLAPGDTFHLNIDYSNNSTADIEDIQVTLYEIITFVVKSTNSYGRTQSYFKKKTRALIDKTLDPQSYANKADYASDLHLRNIPFQLDNTARESYNGKRIQIQHVLSIAVVPTKFMGFCKPEVPCTSLNVHVVSPSLGKSVLSTARHVKHARSPSLFQSVRKVLKQ